MFEYSTVNNGNILTLFPPKKKLPKKIQKAVRERLVRSQIW